MSCKEEKEVLYDFNSAEAKVLIREIAKEILKELIKEKEVSKDKMEVKL